MPITAKLSNKFYERLGDDVASELVEWLNLVDTSYRQDLKDLFDANFRRLESEMAGLRERVEAQVASLRAETATRLEATEERIVQSEGRLEARMDARLAEFKSDLIKWMFIFWMGTMGTVLAMLKL